MWEIQQPGRRAGAPDVDLMSNQPGEMTLLVVCSRVECEKRWKMFEGRAEQVVMFSLLSTGDARGTNSLLWVCGFVVKDVAICWLYIYLL